MGGQIRFIKHYLGVLNMQYQRLPFEQYFTNTSDDYNHSGRATYDVKYLTVKYSYGVLGKIFKKQHEVDYEIHYEEDRDVIQLNFQKTSGFMDWMTNIFEFSDRYYDAIEFEDQLLQLRVHHGWGIMYKVIKREIRRKWQELHEAHPEAHTEVLGWSLGAGQAILCCQDLNYNFGVKPHLFTYGSVKPFKGTRRDRDRLKRYLDTVCLECSNFTDINDIITYMPPFRGFCMIRRVDVSEEVRRTVFKLFNPRRYHTTYDHPQLYIPFMNSGEEKE